MMNVERKLATDSHGFLLNRFKGNQQRNQTHTQTYNLILICVTPCGPVEKKSMIPVNSINQST
jgi:hypothetical protein